MYNSTSTLILPFVALCFLSVMVDRLIMVIEEIMRHVPWLPNRFWGPVAYVLVFTMGYVFCWAGAFNFFAVLGFAFRRQYEGWVMTSLLLSGGSAFVRNAFGLISNIPMIVSEVVSMVTSMVSAGTTSVTGTSDPNSPP